MNNIAKIIEANLPLVPPELLEEFSRVSGVKNPTHETLCGIRRLVNVTYNSLRKSLGYPYDRYAVLTPWYRQTSRALTLISVAMCSASLVLLLSPSPDGRLLSAGALTLLSAAVFIAQAFVLAMARRQRSKR